MSIRKRGGSWLVDVKRGSRRVRRAAPTLAEARALEGRLREQLAAPPARGLEEALLRYLREAKHTHRDYEGLRHRAAHVRPFLTGKTIEQAPDAAHEMRTAWSGELAPATINRRLAILRRLANLAFEWGWVAVPIGARIKMLPEHNERHVYLTPEQVEALAERMPVTGDAVRLAAYTGLRRSELFRLTAESVVDGILVAPTLKQKRVTYRPVPLSTAAAAAAEALPFEFSDYDLRKEWEAARAALGLSHVRFHDLRHTFASWLASAGAGDRVLGALLGHASAQMVKRYAHLKEDALRDAVAALEAPGRNVSPRSRGTRQ